MTGIARAVVSVFILMLAPAAPALAQSAVLCGCYCGINISPPCSEQACKNACGWQSGSGSGGSNQSGPAQLWYCRAVTGKGGAGWAWSPIEKMLSSAGQGA